MVGRQCAESTRCAGHGIGLAADLVLFTPSRALLLLLPTADCRVDELEFSGVSTEFVRYKRGVRGIDQNRTRTACNSS